MARSTAEILTEIPLVLTEKKQVRVLHVDDEAELLKSAKQCLEMQGAFHVETALSVREAKGKMKKRDYDAIVSDYLMPGRDGLQFLKELRASGNDIPFIIFTGKGREEVAIRALNLGADRYFNKIGDPETVYGELAHGVRKAVEARWSLEELQESEEKYRDLIENARDLVLMTDLKGNITFVNRVVEEHGYQRGDIVGKNIIEYFPKKYLSKLRTALATVIRGNRARGDVEIPTPKGTIVAEYYANPVRKRGKIVGFQAILRDFSERKKVEESLRESEERFRRLSEASLEAIAIHDLGKILDANQAFAEMFGYELPEVIGMSALDLAAPESRDLVSQKILAGYEEPYEAVGLRKDGSTFVGELHGKAVPYENKMVRVTAIRDITERKKARQALKESEEKFRLTFESATDAILWADPTTGLITNCNRAAEILLEKNREEIVGHHQTALHPPRKAEHYAKMFKRHIEQKGAFDDEAEVITKSGKIKLVHIAASTTMVGEKPIIQGIFRDITERKKAEEALKESEAKFRNLAEQSPNMIFINKKGRVVYANKRCEEITGYRREEFYSPEFDFFTLVAPESRGVVKSSFGMHMDGKEVPPYEYTLMTKEGERVEALLTTNLITYEGGPAILGTVTDIAEYKKAERAIHESQQKFAGLFRDNPEAAVFVDPNFKILDINTCFTGLFGYSLDEIKGKALSEVIMPEEKTEEGKRLDEKAKKGRIYLHDTVRKRKDGSLVQVAVSAAPITADSQVLGYMGLYKDITEVKKTQEELLKARTHFQRLFELMADPVAIVDGKGRILDVSQKALDVTGFEREDLVGRSFLRTKIASAKTKAILMQKLAKRMMGIHVEPYEVELLTKDRKKLLFELNAAKIEYKGRPADMVVFRDIAERKKMEEKLGVVGSLTRHDVRNKLFTITTNTFLMKRNMPKDHDSLERLNKIESACEQAMRIFDFAKNYEKLGIEELDYIDIEKNFEEAVKHLSDLSGIEVVNDCHGLTLLADSMLKQLLYNLIHNSLRHGEKVHQIRIHYQEVDSDKLRLVYEDDGKGIPNAEKKKIFKKGYGKGTGLGLFLIERMCKVYGWSIQETGKYGKGAQFTITIPKTDGRGKAMYRLD